MDRYDGDVPLRRRCAVPQAWRSRTIMASDAVARAYRRIWFYL